MAKIADRLRRLISRGGDKSDIRNKRPTKETMLIVFLSGILIFVIMLPTGKNNSSYIKRKAENGAGNTANEGSVTADSTSSDGLSADKYKERLEKELEDFLSGVAGVGEADVLIYIESSQEYIVEKDIPMSSAADGDRRETKKEETTVYTKDTDGHDVPFVSQTKSPKIDGVVVAARGASNEAVRLQITKLVMALYGLDANKVEVLRKE